MRAERWPEKEIIMTDNYDEKRTSTNMDIR